MHCRIEVEACVSVSCSMIGGKAWFWIVEEDVIKMWADVVGIL